MKTVIRTLDIAASDVEKIIENCVRYLGADRQKITTENQEMYGSAETVTRIPLANLTLRVIRAEEGKESFASEFYRKYGNGVLGIGAAGTPELPEGADTQKLFGVRFDFLGECCPAETDPDAAEITYIGIVVSSMKDFSDRYVQYLGGRSDNIVYDWDFYTKEIHYGQMSETNINGTHITLDNMMFEFMEPVKQDHSPFRQALDRCGECFYYAGVRRRLDEFTREMDALGLQKPIQNIDGHFICFDTRELFGFRAMIPDLYMN